MTTLTQPAHRRMWVAGLVAALLVGGALRLVWVTDMEYKLDEAWTFDRTQQIGRTEPWPWIGMGTSVATRHAGLSVWVFVVLSRIFAIHDPVALTRACQLVNFTAILLLVAFALREVDAGEREPWLWAAALLCVNPLTVLFHRKIWPPSILPIFSVLLIASWWKRDRRSGAFAWGLIGAWIGQVHEVGIFFAAGFVAWAILFEPRRVAWKHWLVGSCAGGVTAIPWLRFTVAELGKRPNTFDMSRALDLTYWSRWITEPMGIGLDYSLGPQFSDFLSYPLVGGRSTHLVLLLHLLAAAIGSTILLRALVALWPQRRRWRGLLIGRGSPTAFTQSATLWGCGILLSASGLFIHRHYMIITAPLQCLCLARLAVGERSGALKVGRRLLLTLWGCELLLSVIFLAYIHVNGGAAHGDYGIVYRAQETAIHPPF